MKKLILLSIIGIKVIVLFILKVIVLTMGSILSKEKVEIKIIGKKKFQKLKKKRIEIIMNLIKLY